MLLAGAPRVKMLAAMIVLAAEFCGVNDGAILRRCMTGMRLNTDVGYAPLLLA